MNRIDSDDLDSNEHRQENAGVGQAGTSCHKPGQELPRSGTKFVKCGRVCSLLSMTGFVSLQNQKPRANVTQIKLFFPIPFLLLASL